MSHLDFYSSLWKYIPAVVFAPFVVFLYVVARVIWLAHLIILYPCSEFFPLHLHVKIKYKLVSAPIYLSKPGTHSALHTICANIDCTLSKMNEFSKKIKIIWEIADFKVMLMLFLSVSFWLFLISWK